MLQLFQHGGAVRPRQVHFIDEEKRGDVVPLQQVPEGAGVGLDTVGAADHQNGAVQHLEGPLRLGGEVHVARGVQQGDLCIF